MVWLPLTLGSFTLIVVPPDDIFPIFLRLSVGIEQLNYSSNFSLELIMRCVLLLVLQCVRQVQRLLG